LTLSPGSRVSSFGLSDRKAGKLRGLLSLVICPNDRIKRL
jgi:hypothetical protein